MCESELHTVRYIILMSDDHHIHIYDLMVGNSGKGRMRKD